MIDFKEDGTIVNYAHHCPGCRRHTPFPQYQGKCCPRCGTFQGPSVEQIKSQMTGAEAKVCSGCGEKNQPDNNFCTKCGTKL